MIAMFMATFGVAKAASYSWVNMLIFVKPTNVKSDPEGKQKSLDEDKEDKDEDN
jgi:hypothetical protein